MATPYNIISDRKVLNPWRLRAQGDITRHSQRTLALDAARPAEIFPLSFSVCPPRRGGYLRNIRTVARDCCQQGAAEQSCHTNPKPRRAALAASHFIELGLLAHILRQKYSHLPG